MIRYKRLVLTASRSLQAWSPLAWVLVSGFVVAASLKLCSHTGDFAVHSYIHSCNGPFEDISDILLCLTLLKDRDQVQFCIYSSLYGYEWECHSPGSIKVICEHRMIDAIVAFRRAANLFNSSKFSQQSIEM